MFLLAQIHVDTQSGMLTAPQCQHLRAVILHHPTRSATSIAEVTAAFVAKNRKMGLMNLPRGVADVLRSRMLSSLLLVLIGRVRGLRSVCRYFRQWANGQGGGSNGEAGVFVLRTGVSGDMSAAMEARRCRFARALDFQARGRSLTDNQLLAVMAQVTPSWVTKGYPQVKAWGVHLCVV